MTQLNLGTSSLSKPGTGEVPKRPRGRTRRTTIATVLSLLVPGLGQIYARRPWRGVAIISLLTALEFITLKFRLLLTFAGLVSTFLLRIFFHVLAAGDACYLVLGQPQDDLKARNVPTTVAATLITLLLGLYPLPDYFISRSLRFFGAFRITSESMCPAFCDGERIVAARDAYSSRSPRRGELILFDFNRQGTSWTKRVAGVAGDTVERGPNNTILVNGTRLVLPQPCGQSVAFRPHAESEPPFEPLKVPDGTVFVIGDNLDNSYDSRFFGVVPLDEVKGKPLFIYWSRNSSRIGCKLR